MKTKLPPQAPELESAVLGAILIESGILNQVEEILDADDFYEPANQTVYRAIQQLRSSSKPIDMLTVTEELSRMKMLDACGGPYYISQLTLGVASTAHTTYHAKVIQEKSYARKLIRIASGLVDKAYDPAEDIYAAEETFEQQFTSLRAGLGGEEVLHIEDALKEVIKHAEKMQQIHQEGGITGIPTGLEKLDKAINGGWHEPELIIVGARPSMGKTQFALSFARTAAAHEQKTLFCSIETGARQLVTRYILEDERVCPAHLTSGQMTQEEWNALDETAASFWKLPYYIAAHHSIRNLSTIQRTARRMKRKQGLDLLIIDHLGLVKTSRTFQNRYQEVGHITGELKNLAKELQIPIILLAQLSRPPKGQIVKKPKLDDLRESGDIEQDADVVIFIHKREYYDPKAVDPITGKSWKNRGELIIAKNREGERNITLTYAHDKRYKKIFSE